MSDPRETLKAIRMFGLLKVLYWRFVYRHHMRFIHGRGGHQMKYLHPIGGPAFSRCDWCGQIEVDETENQVGEIT